MDDGHRRRDKRRIAVVGPCASGKTTLVEGLKRRGYTAAVCGQEHSEIPTLWRHGEPDVLIALSVDLATVRARRGGDWPESIYRAQQRRLANAVAAADVVLDASRLDAETVLARALAALDGAAIAPAVVGTQSTAHDAAGGSPDR